ncbi:amidase [Pararobbsia silviterrae]|uniref:Amidase n=1 Tax=Pararobbsia silviterrae TaxID=1792498 RepID=A0A494XHG5_9BURK|nr:amidase [Pararobbsia silviterrae]RKP50197.1 amidase [Pararobbsia silviterrae]
MTGQETHVLDGSNDDDRLDAFVPGPRTRIAPTGHGVLDGLRFAVKDLIDVAGVTTGGGNPDWLATHAPAPAHASVVARLLAAGAAVEGKTITDELAYSLEGENAHYGTPLNPHWPHALPGGSSSGSASAVAAGVVDFALGTDTGGSVRVPAAFCGLWGIRPTHGAVPTDGVLDFAPGFDTIGWFARSAEMLERVGTVLLDAPRARGAAKRFTRFDEAFAIRAASEPDDAQALLDAAGLMGALEGVSVFWGDGAQWLDVYQHLQDADIQRSLGDWLAATRPRFGPSIAPRFARLAKLDAAHVAHCAALRARWRARLDAVLDKQYLVLPTTPVSLLSKLAPPAQIAHFYANALAINAVAAFGGYPQITIPFRDERDRPLALSIIGARGDDLAMLRFVRRFDVPSRQDGGA